MRPFGEPEFRAVQGSTYQGANGESVQRVARVRIPIRRPRCRCCGMRPSPIYLQGAIYAERSAGAGRTILRFKVHGGRFPAIIADDLEAQRALDAWHYRVVQRYVEWVKRADHDQ